MNRGELEHRMWSDRRIRTDTETEESLGTKCINLEKWDADREEGAVTLACPGVLHIEAIWGV